MPSVKGKVWTKSRQVMGNLVPGLLSIPFAVAGLWMWRPEDPLALLPICLLAAFPLVGWFSVSLFGLWSNSAMRDELGARFGRERGRPEGELMFVGLAWQGYRSIWDPHQDLALLQIRPDTLEFFGDSTSFSLKRSEVQAVGLGKNTHSYLGLGGWVRLSCRQGVLGIEPRMANTLLGNRRRRKQLLTLLQAWLDNKEGPKPTA